MKALDRAGTTPDDAFLWTYCAPVMEGIELLAAWIEDVDTEKSC